MDNTGRNKPILRKDTFRIKTRLCSNKTSRDKNLRDLFRLDLSELDPSGQGGTSTSAVIDSIGLVSKIKIVGKAVSKCSCNYSLCALY